MTLRKDLALVASLIPAGSRVLDLGCASGQLLSHLMNEQGCRGTGVEIDSTSVLAAIRLGIPVIELDLDLQLDDFADDSYDVVVLSRTIQTIRRPQEVLRQMGRIGRRLIVSVPNFGWYGHRLRLLRGRMPMSRELPYEWYNTPNIHLFTLKDFLELCRKDNIRILDLICQGRGFAERGLAWIEKAGNRVPSPAILFLALIIGVILISQILDWANVSVTSLVANPADGSLPTDDLANDPANAEAYKLATEEVGVGAVLAQQLVLEVGACLEGGVLGGVGAGDVVAVPDEPYAGHGGGDRVRVGKDLFNEHSELFGVVGVEGGVHRRGIIRISQVISSIIEKMPFETSGHASFPFAEKIKSAKGCQNPPRRRLSKYEHEKKPQP
mgnify:CR=1 FL=1